MMARLARCSYSDSLEARFCAKFRELMLEIIKVAGLSYNWHGGWLPSSWFANTIIQVSSRKEEDTIHLNSFQINLSVSSRTVRCESDSGQKACLVIVYHFWLSSSNFFQSRYDPPQIRFRFTSLLYNYLPALFLRHLNTLRTTVQPKHDSFCQGKWQRVRSYIYHIYSLQ